MSRSVLNAEGKNVDDDVCVCVCVCCWCGLRQPERRLHNKVCQNDSEKAQMEDDADDREAGGRVHGQRWVAHLVETLQLW